MRACPRISGYVEHCGYGELQDEILRDRIVVAMGLQDVGLSEKLQLEPDLTYSLA